MAPAQVSIFYGSQSGTAECFAEEINDEASQHGITTEVFDLRSFTAEAFAMKKIVVLVVATYGDGEPTDNAVDFCKWGSNPGNDGALKGQRFCVMGLGDMNYTRFCQFGRDTDCYLERLGASRIYGLGIGDDSQDIAADFKKWKEGGFWSGLKKAVAEVSAEGGFEAMALASKKTIESEKLPLYLYVGHEEKNGAARDITEALTEKLKAKGLNAIDQQCLSNRKACEVVKKMPKQGLALCIVDSAPDGLCSAGKKLARNMTVELDKACLKEKCVKYLTFTVATSKCCSSAAALKNQIQQNCATSIGKAFERAGAESLNGRLPDYVDVGVEDPEPVLDELCRSLCAMTVEPSGGQSQQVANATQVVQPTMAGPGPKTLLLCTGNEAREAAQALSKGMGNRCSVEDAALVSLAGAARNQTQVVLVVDCSEEGLSDGARGLSSGLNKAPASIQAQLAKLKFALLTVVMTDVGNAGERANANAARNDIAKAVEPISRNLEKFGACKVTSACLDLQDATEDTLREVCEGIKDGFRATSELEDKSMRPKTEIKDGPSAQPARLPAPTPKVDAAPAPGTIEVRLADSVATLPSEAEGEPADVLSRFYFEAEQTKVLKVRQLRQAPNAEEGLSTVEVEFDAVGSLKDYSLGGTLSLLPQSDPSDVNSVLPLFGLKSEDLKKPLTFVVGAGTKFKRPFPTPCTLGKALADYCDLARAPTKKMLTAMQPKLQDAEAKERVAILLKDEEALKMLHSSASCCNMHEFWALLGVSQLDLCDFLLHCPRQKPREFTIASCPKATPGKITLCVSLTSHTQDDLGALLETLREKGISTPGVQAPSRTNFFGVCSTWLNTRLKVGDQVLAKQRGSALKLPEKDVPVIMIGAGAGVAPFRGFWESLRKGPQSAPAVLFFGCRHPDKDWLFKDEMNGAVRLRGTAARMQVGPKRPLAALYPAFSRPDDAAGKMYVQDMIREQSSMVKAGMEQDGCVYICGSTAMGNAALEALGEAIEGGAAAVEKLRKEGRIVAEMWG